VQLFVHPISNHARKCRAVARHLGLDVEEKTVDLFGGETRSPAYRAISPMGKIPALVDGDLSLFESNAISIHLASKSESPLFPEGPRRSAITSWMFFESAELGPPYLTVARERIVKPMVGASTDEGAVERAMKPLARATKALNAALEGKTWLLGEELTLADFAVACQTSLALPLKLDLTPYPNVARHLAQLEEIPAWRSTGGAS
jgi:glutathione S-transferase